MLLLVAGYQAALCGLDPDLEEMDEVLVGCVELAVAHARARAHALHVAGVDHRPVAHGVLVREAAFEHVADDLHVAMAVGAEALASYCHAVFVDDAKRTEAHVLWVVIVGERKGVERLEPAMVGEASFCAAADFHLCSP